MAEDVGLEVTTRSLDEGVLGGLDAAWVALRHAPWPGVGEPIQMVSESESSGISIIQAAGRDSWDIFLGSLSSS